MIKKFLLSVFLSTAIISGGFSQNSQKTTAAINLNWQELGPTNSGGKVKAILTDRSNPNRVIAAAASGGLWQTNDAGLNWTKIKDDFDNNIITCITQSSDGSTFYVGTGERAYGFIGGGIWKSTDGASTFTQLASTVPANLNDSTSAFAYVNALAADSLNTSKVYAATNKGLMVSNDGGATWTNAITGFNNWSTDVKVTKDGFVIAAVDSVTNTTLKKKMSAWVSSSGSVGSFTQVSGSGSGKLPNTGGAFSVKFAIAPSDVNYIYAAVVKHYTMVGIYKSTDKGSTWSVIGPGGASTFNPFGSNAGTPASYAYTIAVDPSNKDFLFAGGQDVYTYTPTQNWSQLTSSQTSPVYPLYCHDNIHAFTFTKDHVWVASDGGVSKGSPGVSGFVVVNNGLANMQVNDLAPTPDGSLLLSTNAVGANIMGANGGSASFLYGNVGGSIAASYINPTASFVTDVYGQLFRSNKTEKNSYGHPYNDRILNKTTMNVANIGNYCNTCNAGAANKKTPMAFWESKNDPFSKDSTLYTNHTGSIILPAQPFTAISPNANTPFTSFYNDTIHINETVKIPHKVQARLAVGYNSEVWMGDDALDFIGTPEWFRAAGYKPIYFPSGGNIPTKNIMPQGAIVSAITFTGNGNTLLFAATVPGSGGGAYLYRLQNVAFAYDSLHGDVSSDSCQLVGAKIGFFANRNISSIAVDPNDSNNVVIVMNGYNNTSYVYRTSNLMSLPDTNNAGNFENIQTNLPKMPIYDAIIDYNNHNQIILGTDAGIYSTDNGFASSPSAVNWGPSNTGIAKVPVMALAQQTRDYTEVAGSGYIYAGTFGRGVFRTATLASLRNVEADAATVKNKKTLLAYPNPTSDNVTVKFNLSKESYVSIKMYDITGKLVYTNNSNTASGNNTHQIKVSDFESGVYVVTVTGNNIKEYVNVVVTK